VLVRIAAEDVAVFVHGEERVLIEIDATVASAHEHPLAIATPEDGSVQMD
jgi:metallophosphoesterase superfamily enzyme